MSKAGSMLTLLTGGTLALLVGTSGCAERLADCVEVYANTGATRLRGYTRTSCEDHCRSVQGWIDCYWDGSIMSVTGPSVTVLSAPRGEGS